MRGRKRTEPRLYRRGPVWWCYWQGERWSTDVPSTESEEAARRAVREETDPIRREAHGRGVGDAAALLFAALETRGRSESTRRVARTCLGHFERIWAGLSLADIEAAGWDGLQAYIAKRRAEPGKRGANVSRLTVAFELDYLRQAWRLAKAKGWVSKPWDEMKPERFDRGHRPKTRWLTAHEVRQVMAALPPHRAAWVAWVVATGSDVGDVGRAEAGDIDWKRGLVRVRGTKTAFRDRWVPITDVNEALLKVASKHGPPFAPWPEPDAWVSLQRVARRLGIEPFCPKDLRRTHGHWLRHAGAPSGLIGHSLGHGPNSALADRVYAQGEAEAMAKLLRAAVRTRVRTGGAKGTNGKRGTPATPGKQAKRRKQHPG